MRPESLSIYLGRRSKGYEVPTMPHLHLNHHRHLKSPNDLSYNVAPIDQMVKFFERNKGKAIDPK
jgi:hypothetical protein